MKLTVNGVQIRVVDRIEIVIEAKEGEELIHGMDIRCIGGPLTIRSGPNGSAFRLETDRTIFFRGSSEGAFFQTNDPNPPVICGISNSPIEVTANAHVKLGCRAPEPALYFGGDGD